MPRRHLRTFFSLLLWRSRAPPLPVGDPGLVHLHGASDITSKKSLALKFPNIRIE
jgi:hypothetical protein